jgi:hypothetical protein
MSADVRNPGPVSRQDDQRGVAARPEEGDAEESWSITIRPYRARSSDQLLEDLSSSNSGCGP